MRTISILVLGLALTAACDKKDSNAGGPGAARVAAADAPCDQVVDKLASFNPSSGAPERKLWTNTCPEMPATMRACIVAAKTKDDLDKCGK
jgi:hypothetical protein